MDDFSNGGGVIVDISGLQKPAKYQPIVKRTRQYIDAMNYAKRPVSVITMGPEEYDGILRALIVSAKKHSMPDVVGLRFGEIPIRRAGDGC